ncbi:hypothetical protein CTI12_AA232350 [Artemisia annua]|uniref:Uncharacterized protein n=1 Tax=Artemisia annua TaxID=35608 RepID=A0A2U1NT76_ARTAN|nr:hypothetical protein CTI12_AA232350 [Artemisia annua]
MASSSKGGALSLDIYYNGYFSLKPLTYHNADMLTTTVDVTPLTFSELKIFVQNNIGSVVTGLYYFSNGLKCIKSDDDLRLFVEKWQSTDEGIIALYVSHNNESLIEYSGDYVLVILNPATYYKDSDDESDVASLDHLSEGEEELRQVRIKERQILDEKKKTNEVVVFDESKLVLENESDDNENEHEVDPLFSDLGDESQKDKPHVEPEVNLDEDMPISDEDEIVFDPNKRDYPIHDPNTHWKLKKPRLGMDCDAVENGLSESFNSHIKNARRKPIIGMLEDIRSYVMTRNYTLMKECQDWTSDICPNIIKVLELHKKIQRKWSLNPSGWHQFEVRQGNLEAYVDTTPNVVPANEDEARLKRRYDDFWQGQYNAGYRPPRRTSQRLSMNNYNRKVIKDYAGQGVTPDEAFDVE